jgi:hypothetical protein
MIGGCRYDVIETGQKFRISVELAEPPHNITNIETWRIIADTPSNVSIFKKIS